jgi:hypothetical protein
MSNHYTYMYFVPHKANTRPTYNPETFSFICHYGSRTHGSVPMVASLPARRPLGILA